MRRFVLPVALALSLNGFAGELGIVNLPECMEHSKLGKSEQENFDSLKKQMTSMMGDVQKELQEISGKLNDADYLDTLSPQAEKDMKAKFQTLSEELSRYQNQYYQVMNQANMKVMQTIGAAVNEAAEKVAKDKHLSYVINKDACFYADESANVTKEIIKHMDKDFEGLKKEQQAQVVDSSKE